MAWERSPPRSGGRATRRIVWVLAALLGTYFALWLVLEASLAISQPVLDPGAAEGVLRTFDAQGRAREARLVVLDDGDTQWIQSGHHFRGWYDRLRRNPDVELLRGGEVGAYRAVPVDTPEARARVVGLLKERTGVPRFYLIRALLLFAEIKPVRLDPRPVAAGG